MRRIKYIKDHLEHKAGDTQLTTIGMANYLIRVGAAIELKDEKPAKEVKADPCQAKNIAAPVPKKTVKKAVKKAK